MTLVAFHGDKTIKAKYLARVRAHQEADHLIHGEGWNGEKGCAVGCTLEAYDHARYPVELGIPEWLARVEDTLQPGTWHLRARGQRRREWPPGSARAESVRSAAESAGSARSAAWSSRSARWAAGSARSAAESAGLAGSATYDHFATELLKLLKAAKAPSRGGRARRGKR